MQMELKLEYKAAFYRFNKNSNSEDDFSVDSTLAHEMEQGKTEMQQFGLVENASNGKKPIRNWSRGKGGSSGDCSKGKAVLWCGEVEELKKRLKILEEETETMKEALFESMEERNSLMKETHQQFQQLHGFLFPSNLLIQENSRDTNSTAYGPKDVRVGTSLSEILQPHSNPSLVSRDLRANILTVEEASQELHLLSDRSLLPSVLIHN